MRRIIGNRLRAARLAANLKQQDVASDFSHSRQTISSWEAGRTLPDVEELLKLAILYGVSTDRILMGEDMEGQAARVLARVRAAPPDAQASDFADFAESQTDD